MRPSLRVALSIALLMGALLVLQFRSSSEAVPIRKPLDSFPNALGGWQGTGETIFDLETLSVLKSTDYVMRRYQNPEGRQLWLFIAYWDSQRKGAQPHSPKNCLPGAGWDTLETSQVTIPLAQPFAPITINRFLIQKDSDQLLVFYWYQSQGKAVAGEMAAKVAMVRNSIVHHRTDGALVRVTSPVYGSVQQTADLLVKYIEAMYPVLGQYLPD